jgi:hypothetical protein
MILDDALPGRTPVLDSNDAQGLPDESELRSIVLTLTRTKSC